MGINFVHLKDYILYLLSRPVCSIISNTGWALGKVPYIFKIVPYIFKILMVKILLFLNGEVLY